MTHNFKLTLHGVISVIAGCVFYLSGNVASWGRCSYLCSGVSSQAHVYVFSNLCLISRNLCYRWHTDGNLLRHVYMAVKNIHKND